MTKNDILQFLGDKLALDNIDLEELASDDSILLFTDGILDSLSLIELLKFIEDSSEISIDPEEVDLKNFDSIKRILAYVEARTSELNPN